MRYASEFFASLFEPKRAKAFSKAAARLQDLLGYANDYAVCIEQMKSLVAPETGENTSALMKAAGIVIGWHGAEMARADQDVDDAWKGFLGVGRFWNSSADQRVE